MIPFHRGRRDALLYFLLFSRTFVFDNEQKMPYVFRRGGVGLGEGGGAIEDQQALWQWEIINQKSQPKDRARWKDLCDYGECLIERRKSLLYPLSFGVFFFFFFRANRSVLMEEEDVLMKSFLVRFF